MATAQKRLLKELRTTQLKLQQPEYSLIRTLGPTTDDSIFDWSSTIEGPLDTPYAGGTFKLRLHVPQEYPNKPPRIVFETKVSHANVRLETGEICLDILQGEWTPAWDLCSAVLAVIELLREPGMDSPLNVDVANILRARDTKAYYGLVGYYVKKYATNP